LRALLDCKKFQVRGDDTIRGIWETGLTRIVVIIFISLGPCPRQE
jgi:hypothetical protein